MIWNPAFILYYFEHDKMGQLTEAERLASCLLLVSLRVALTEGLFITLLHPGKCLQGMSDAVGGKLNRTLSRLQYERILVGHTVFICASLRQTNMPRVTHFDTDMGGLSFAPNGHRGHAASNASLLAPEGNPGVPVAYQLSSGAPAPFNLQHQAFGLIRSKSINCFHGIVQCCRHPFGPLFALVRSRGSTQLSQVFARFSTLFIKT
ncbi:hypothetical protein NXS19_005010 [Fusarium pseudograminearum]|nr:hypothetical protein NXS19_005010 [Fusarium pseudograminearum]